MAIPDHPALSARPAPRDRGAASGPPLSRGQALGDRSLASSSRSPNSLGGLVLRQFLQAPPDRARRNPGRHRDRCDAPITGGKGLRRRDQTTAPFIEKRGHRRKPLSDGFDIDHHYNIWYSSRVVNLYLTLSKVDSIISGRALSDLPDWLARRATWVKTGHLGYVQAPERNAQMRKPIF